MYYKPEFALNVKLVKDIDRMIEMSIGKRGQKLRETPVDATR